MDPVTVRDAYWAARPRPPSWNGDDVEWCEATAQHYMMLAAFLRDQRHEQEPSPLSRTDA